MISIVVACVVLPVTALLYGRLGLRRARDARSYRDAVARSAELVLDPYHPAVGRMWHEDETQAAAARLLLDGLATVNRRGNLSLTGAGADPAHLVGHPLPDALLAALRRRTAPASLGNVELRDAGFRAVRDGFRADCRALLPFWPADPPRERGCLGCTGVMLLIGEFAFAMVVVVERLPRGPVEWVAAVATGLALIAQIVWFDEDAKEPDPERRDPLAERLGREGRHPALVELDDRDPQAAARLRVSRMRTRRGRNHGRPRRRHAPTGAGV
ncbi:hypothetical protein [Streptomyces sp. NPDC051183]|uniref:hypothetical protein n=1 Tax=Streptomyces sp. NPDC051183 TaxID=3155165 RepID=UPI00341C293E